MEKVQRLKGWQLGVLVALLALLLSTMFMPAVHYNGEVCKKIVEDYKKEIKDNLQDGKSKAIDNLFDGSWLGGLVDATTDKLVDEWLDELAEYTVDDDEKKIDENIADKEAEDGVKIRNISPFRIMTHSLAKLIINKDAKDAKLKGLFGKKYEEYNKSYNRLRICLWVVYIAAFIILLVVITGFTAGWSKKMPLITALAYSVLAAIFFVYLRFGFMKHIWKKFMKLTLDDAITKMMPTKPLNHLYSAAIPIALVVCVIIVVISIASLVITEKEEVLDYNRDYGYNGGFYGNDGSPDSALRGTQAFVNDLDVFDRGKGQLEIRPLDDEVSGYIDTEESNQKSVIPIVQSVVYGKVCCTKGIALGQGFQLPTDRKVIVGKSPSKTNLTINHPNISNVHCSIRYNPAMNTYIVKDHSTNGTFVNGVRLQRDVVLEFPAGTVLVLADGTNEITLG